MRGGGGGWLASLLAGTNCWSWGVSGVPTQTTRHVEAHILRLREAQRGGDRRVGPGVWQGGWLVSGWFWMAVWEGVR
ncbi:hypothetical protein E2C01_013337 [Portunus trituberculatus]|uniref:Secreted protein n=1 Tax=Portunus trituberculatus TaxID=210409 RepID=A0A5B7DH22_PORTR|nr:hypothetical protein [Portunus trituberculatus]